MTPPRPPSRPSLFDARIDGVEERMGALEQELDTKSIRIMRELGAVGDRINAVEAECRRIRDRLESLEREERKLRTRVESLPEDALATETGVHRLEKLQEVLRTAAATEAKLAIAQRDVDSYRVKVQAYEQKQQSSEARRERTAEKRGDRRFDLLKLIVTALLAMVGGAVAGHYTNAPAEPPAIHAPSH